MEYLSTKELSELWNISVSRIIRLTKEGRIPEAKLVGKSYVFPPDAKKPADNRRRENKNTGEKTTSEFHFPLYLYCGYSDKQINDTFSEDEKLLYCAQKMFYLEDYAQAADTFTKLIKCSSERNVVYGALYYLCIASIYLDDYYKACQYYHRINILYSEETEHKEEFQFLIHDLETYFFGNEYYVNGLKIDENNHYPNELFGYIILEAAYSELLKHGEMQECPDLTVYELISITGQPKISDLCTTMLNTYLAYIYWMHNRNEKAEYYITRACNIAEKNHLEGAFAIYYKYFPDLYINTLIENNPELLAKIQEKARKQSESFHGLLDYLNKGGFLQILNPMDYRLIKYAREGMTHKEIAPLLNLSVVSISKKYSELYEKTQTHNKHELYQKCEKLFEKY